MSCGADVCDHDPTCEEEADFLCAIGLHDWEMDDIEGEAYRRCSRCSTVEDLDDLDDAGEGP